MNINKISAIFFSPTDSTKELLSIFCQSLPLPIEFIDITSHKQANATYNFMADELVIFAIPVYSGRVPTVAIERILKMQGSQNPAILIANYGNREYEDALLELKNTVENKGFLAIAGAAFISEHSIMHSVASGRPDKEDRLIIKDFADKVWQKVQNCQDFNTKLEIKGNFPYRAYKNIALKAKASKKCTQCGACAVACPAEAIPSENPQKTKQDICITCMRCIKICPVKARKVNPIKLYLAEKSFCKKYGKRKEAEIFI